MTFLVSILHLGASVVTCTVNSDGYDETKVAFERKFISVFVSCSGKKKIMLNLPYLIRQETALQRLKRYLLIIQIKIIAYFTLHARGGHIIRYTLKSGPKTQGKRFQPSALSVFR